MFGRVDSLIVVPCGAWGLSTRSSTEVNCPLFGDSVAIASY